MTQLKTLITKPTFCSLPWKHVELNLVKDSVSTCPRSVTTMGSITDGVPVVWTNQTYNSIRQSFLAENIPVACTECDGDYTTVSYKQHRNTALKINGYLGGDTDTLEAPVSVSVVLSNISNVAPRVYETVGTSSKTEELASNNQVLRRFVPIVEEILPITSLQGSFVNAKRVTIEGGEPTMHPHIIPLIDMILEESGNKLRQLVISTNMTYRNVELLDKLKSLSDRISVIFNVLIDGNSNTNEYIRHGANWNTIVDNINFTSTKYNFIRYIVLTHISILNIGYLPELFETLDQLQTDYKKFRIDEVQCTIDKEQHLSPTNLPYDVKQQYLNKINDFEFVNLRIKETKKILDSCKRILQSAPNRSMTAFYDYITAFDTAAGTDYKLLYPELVVGAPT